MQMALLLYVTAIVLPAVNQNAEAAFRSGDFPAARTAYERRIAAEPNDVTALLGLATTELYANDLAATRRDVDRLVALAPSDSRVQRLARTLAIRAGNPEEFHIAQRGDAILPFAAQDPLPVVTITINGVDARAAIDTGGPTFTVTDAFAAAHHLPVTDAGLGTFAGGRKAPVRTTLVDSISVGPVSVQRVPAYVMQGPSLDVDAIIGTGFFTHFLTTLDYTHQTLIFRPYDAEPPRSALADVPMWLTGDHFIFAWVRVNGVRGLFNIDSGSDMGVQMTKTSLAQAQITPQSNTPQQFIGGGGAVRSFPFTASSVSLGGATLHDVKGRYFPDGDQYGIFPFSVAGTLSGGFLKHYAVTFDFKRMRLVLQ